MTRLVSFTQATRTETQVVINPDAVAALTHENGKTVIHLRAPTANGHGLVFTVKESIDVVKAALTA